MAEKKKRKVKDNIKHDKERDEKRKRRILNSESLNGVNKAEIMKEENMKKGPRLPNVLLKELNLTKFNDADVSNSDEEVYFNSSNLYEYEEGIPEEESRKNHRFDHVENFEYELPEQFEDENVSSDDDDDSDSGKTEMGESVEKVKDFRHARMLQEITGLPSVAFQEKKMINNTVITEAYPESGYNPSHDVLHGEGQISVDDLLDSIHGKSGLSKVRKSIASMKRKSISIQAPLPKPEQERLERTATYEQSKKEITKWEPLVKRNREVPTLYFDEDANVGFSTVGAIVSDFKPRTEFEKKIASFLNDNEVMEAHSKDGARLLEMNKISVEDEKERRNRLARMRSLLFSHEMKAKRIKKIKSKAYHRLSKKDKSKTVAAQMEMDPEAAKELARKQEFKRAEERMRLKHKNNSKWAKRILKRGLDVQDEGTRAAIAEQLHEHALLTRKMNTVGSSSSDDSSDQYDSDEDFAGEDQEDGASKLLEKAKEKTLEILQNDDETPKSGVLALPFMVRGMERREKALQEEARLALQEYEASTKQLEDDGDDAEGLRVGTSTGRKVFGPSTKQVQAGRNSRRLNHNYDNPDSEDDLEVEESVEIEQSNHLVQKDVKVDPDFLREDSEINHDTIFKEFDEIAKNQGHKTTYEVAIFASKSWKKNKNAPVEKNERMKRDVELDMNVKNSAKAPERSVPDQNCEELDDSETESEEGHMVDGILSSGTNSTYKLPAQEELIRRAFACDDVEEEFDKFKEEFLNDEIPEVEKPILLPGWGQWTEVQKKKGIPSWMSEEHEKGKKKREEAIKKRKDAHLKNVIISEKLVKKAEKLYTKTLPHPFTSKEVFEQSIRMPLGPEFNPLSTVGVLNRPEVVKRQGLIIKPIEYKDIDPHKSADEGKRGERKHKSSKPRNQAKKMNTKGSKK